MAGGLTHEQARRRAELLRIESYGVEIDLTTGDELFESVTTVRFSCTAPGQSTFIDLASADIREIVLNGKNLSADTYCTEQSRIPLHDLAEHNELRVLANLPYSRTGEGLHRSTDPADGQVYLHSHFETTDAHRVYACFDQPDLKATFQWTVTTPDHWIVVSNVDPEAVRDAESAPAHLTNAKRWHFPTTAVLPTYITALVAGPYHVWKTEHDGIALGLYSRRSLAEYVDVDNLFEVTQQGLDYYQRELGVRYPFAKYDQVFAPDFNTGAMENAACVIYREDYLFRSRVTDAMAEKRASLMLHEMAHMWFGDLVTMRWWDDLWLKESLATYLAALAQAERTRWGKDCWTTFTIVEKDWAYRQDQLPSTHPVVADIPDIHAVEVNFDGITYAKGASVLRQLAAYVGPESLLAGLHDYLHRHAFDNARLKDLLSTLEGASGRDLSAWSKAWLQTSEVNTLRPAFTLDDQGRFESFTLLQEASADYPTLRPHRVAIGLYDRMPSGGAPQTSAMQLVRRRRVELDAPGGQTPVVELIGEKAPDLVLVNDDDLTYAKIRFDQTSLATLTLGGLAEFRESLPQALSMAAAWDMTRDAEMRARDYVRLVTNNLHAISHVTLLQTVLRQADMAIRQYAHPSWRAAGRDELAAVLRALVNATAPGGDHQLIYLNALTDVCRSPHDLAYLRAILDRTNIPRGLTVDTDLRWTLLYGLVAEGAADVRDIDHELAHDQTATGQRLAAKCRAAIPTADAKAATWAAVTSGTLSGPVLQATIAGFMHPDHHELLLPYAAAYFDIVGVIWSDQTSDVAQKIAGGCYPAQHTSRATITMTERYIAAANPPSALRRVLLEGADGVGRALRAQQHDLSRGSTVVP